MTQGATAVRVWDLPTRIFHWVLALCIVGSVTSAKIGGNAMVWHFRFGFVVFTLLLFRIVWGVVGGHWSRFNAFSYSPATLLRYLRGQSLPGEHHDVGHSPLGALSVFGLLGLLALQVCTGLFADDEIANTGPLIQYVSGATSLVLTRWHKNFGQWLIIGMVMLHIAAVLFYALKKKRVLVRPMLTGDKLLGVAAPRAVDNLRSRTLAAVACAACAALVAWIVNLGA